MTDWSSGALRTAYLAISKEGSMIAEYTAVMERSRIWDAAWNALSARDYAGFDRLMSEFNREPGSAEQASPDAPEQGEAA